MHLVDTLARSRPHLVEIAELNRLRGTRLRARPASCPLRDGRSERAFLRQATFFRVVVADAPSMTRTGHAGTQ